LGPFANGTIRQDIKIQNSAEGQKPVVMKFRVLYSVNGQQVEDMKLVQQLPTNY